MLRHGRYPKFPRPAHHHEHLRRTLDKMLHVSQPRAVEIHYLAPDQVGAVEIPVVPRRQLAARDTNLRAPQGLRLVPILNPRQFHRQRAAAAAAGLDAVVLPDPALTQHQISMLEQALRRVGVRTWLDPSSDAKRCSHES